MSKKPLALSTRWFLGNEDDAVQIAEWFHGEGSEAIGNYNYDEYLAMIRNAVVGQPKKQVLALVEWALKRRNESHIAVQTGHEIEPFIAAVAFDEWAQKRGVGKYAREMSV